MIPFATMEDEDRNLIDLAFSKKKADDRKEWLREYIVSLYLLFACLVMTYFFSPELILSMIPTKFPYQISLTRN